MARTLRTKSETGIYHVMMRGVNHQIIFEQPTDYSRFQKLLGQFANPKDEQNRPQPPRHIGVRILCDISFLGGSC